MRAFIASVLVAIAIAIGSAFVLNADNRPVYEAFSTSGARVSDPGHNLVGDRWSGLNQGG